MRIHMNFDGKLVRRQFLALAGATAIAGTMGVYPGAAQTVSGLFDDIPLEEDSAVF